MAGFKPNRTGIRSLESTPQMGEAMRQLAERVAERAREISPVDTGRYKASHEVSVVERDGKKCGRVSNGATDPETGFVYSTALEHGTEHMDAQRILGRSLDVLRGI